MKIAIATLETGNFTFKAVGLTVGEALEAVRVGWTHHIRTTGAADKWSDVRRSVNVLDATVGECYRDGHPLGLVLR